MEDVAKFFSDLFAACRELFLSAPIDILYLGVITGALAATGQEKYKHGNKGLLNEIYNASNHLALVACCAVAVYIFIIFTFKGLIYYAIALAAGVIVRKAVQYILGQIAVVDFIVSTFLTIISGPFVLFACWLFYTGQLVSTFKNILP